MTEQMADGQSKGTSTLSHCGLITTLQGQTTPGPGGAFSPRLPDRTEDLCQPQCSWSVRNCDSHCPSWEMQIASHCTCTPCGVSFPLPTVPRGTYHSPQTQCALGGRDFWLNSRIRESRGWKDLGHLLSSLDRQRLRSRHAGL